MENKGENEKAFHGRCAVRLLLSSAAIALLVGVQFPSLAVFEHVSVISFQDKEDYNVLASSDSTHERNKLNFTLQPHYQNPVIRERNCSVTVLFVDPDLGKDSMWALESVVANILPLETTCVLLQTSVCDVMPEAKHITPPTKIKARTDNTRPRSSNNDELLLYRKKADRVRNLAEPLFGNLIDQGNVRMNVLNHTRYNLRSCNNFYNPSHLLENYHFWGPDEFLAEDSDLILMMQGDAVLCHPLHIDKWRDVAWVGAPWPARKGNQGWHFCSFLPNSWKEFHQHVGSNAPLFPTEDQLCTDTTYGPQGNGGLGLRSRSWLRKAIEYCPVVNRTLSGLSQEAYDAAPCKATNVAAEDIYFVTILRGLGAPLPNNYEAALFSLELRSPAAIEDQYNLNLSFVEDMIQKRWFSAKDPTGMDLYRSMVQAGQNLSNGVDPLVPIGLHKPWNGYLGHRINEKYLNQQCPYMMNVVENSKYGKRYLQKKKLKDEG